MHTHRSLTVQEIDQLTQNGCSCSDWGAVSVKHGFDPVYVRNTLFSGKIEMGIFESEFALPGGLKKHAGINCAVIHNCTIGDNVVIDFLALKCGQGASLDGQVLNLVV